MPMGGPPGIPDGIERREPDAWITVQTLTALYKDHRLAGRSLAVDSVQGVVTLRGKVESNEAKAAAAGIAKGIEGAKEVRNELVVVPAVQRAQIDAADEVIGRLLKDRLRQDPHLQGELIGVRVDASVVTLLGEVRTEAASARAAEIAREVPGVRAVKNELARVSPPDMSPAGRRSGRSDSR
jgi:hyperosmotically inducible periplasmic protein